MKKLLLLIILLIVPTIEVQGSYCNYQDVAKYKKIASNINYSYEYEEINNDVVFHITLVNLNPALYLKDSKNNIYNYTSNEIVVDAKSGENLIFYVYPTDTFCNQKEYLYTLRVQLPTYNTFYKDPLCVGIENYTLCNKWSTHNLSYENFKQKVIEYKESLNKPQVIVEDEEKGLLYYIIFFLTKYYYLVLLAIIITSYIIYIRNKKNNIYN